MLELPTIIWNEYLPATEAFLNGCAMINLQQHHQVPLVQQQQALDHHGWQQIMIMLEDQLPPVSFPKHYGPLSQDYTFGHLIQEVT